MTKYMSRFISIVLSFIIFTATVPITAFASDQPLSDEYEMDETYKEELSDLGFTSSQIDEFSRITNRLAQTISDRERDSLMRQYHELVDGTPYAAAASLYSPEGGTLNLDYTGNLSAISNVIYTKVIYMPSEQVVYYQKALNDPDFMDWIVAEGIGVVTSAAAAKIAAYLGITSSGLTWLVGLPISATFFILQNLETWDLNDAIDRSTTGKVKLEFYYMTSISFPYYQEYENFEPWNSSYIDIPADYDYSYDEGEYNFD